MNEIDLRKYVNKEIALTEAVGDFTSEDVKQIWGSFVNVFKVTNVALKSVLSALVLNIEVIFSMDEEKRKKADELYQSRRINIENEYKSLLEPAREAFRTIEPVLFLVNPGAYLWVKISQEGIGSFGDIRDFFVQIGIDITSNRIPGSFSHGGEHGKDLGMMYGLFGGGTRGTEGSITKILDHQKSIQMSMDKLFGMLSSKVTEGVLSEKKDIQSNIDLFLKELMTNMTPKDFGIDENAEKSIIELKKIQANSYVSNIEAPLKFLKKLSNAKTLQEVKEAIKILKGTIFTLKGIEKLTPEYLEKSANEAIQAAQKKGKLNDLFDEIGIKVPKEKEEQLNAVKAYQLRILLGSAIVEIRNDLTKQIEELKKVYLKKFVEDVDLETLKKISPNSNLEKILLQGVQNIKNAGKR